MTFSKMLLKSYHVHFKICIIDSSLASRWAFCSFPPLEHQLHWFFFFCAIASTFHLIIFLNPAHILSFITVSSYWSLINLVISTTLLSILLYSPLYCIALNLLFFAPPTKGPFFFVPKLGPCMITFCILLSTCHIVKHIVGA